MSKLPLFSVSWMGTAVISALSLKLCCWGPLLLTGIAGVSGSSAYFSWMVALKPYLLGISFGSLAFAFYQVYRPTPRGCSCSKETRSAYSATAYVWLTAVFVAGMTLVSYSPTAPMGTSLPGPQHVVGSNLDTMQLHVEGMTCSGCETNINRALYEMAGIHRAETSHEAKTTVVVFDKSQVKPQEIQHMIRSKGYITKR